MSDQDTRQIRRSQFAVVTVLAPLNETFARKYLILPFYPDVMKLGRQTNAKSTASADNGFFDSRVLSRQHAEIWADQESGKVWIRDCKSSNGTYINGNRLSPENTESEPFELKKGDGLDLGIDIMSSDEKEKVYKRISARVEKVSMIPLNVTPTSNANRPDRKRPSISRSPSLETLKSSNSSEELQNSDAIYGNTLETMAINHVNTTTGGSMVKEDVKLHVEFELAAKRLVADIRAVRSDTAKIKSVTALLKDIKRLANETENRDNAERQKVIELKRDLETKTAEKAKSLKSASLAALKAENTRIRAELALFKREEEDAVSERLTNPVQALVKEHDLGHIKNNVLTLVGSAILMTLAGIWVMYFFNPPAVPNNGSNFFNSFS